MVAPVISTGSAVALCSWTTIVGYGSLLAARNRALQGFGAMAILGEVACLLAAIVALPSLVLWLRGRAQLPTAAAPARSSRPRSPPGPIVLPCAPGACTAPPPSRAGPSPWRRCPIRRRALAR
jgi:hypothetical protein